MTYLTILSLVLALLGVEDWSTALPGQWLGAEKGDAVRGGKLVDGGARVRFVHGQKGSRTPWNVTFIVPASGHMNAETVSGGCGFYPSGKAWCRGYGIPAEGEAMQTEIAIERLDDQTLRIAVKGLINVAVTRGGP